MNKTSKLFVIIVLGGFASWVSAYCNYSNKELQDTCSAIELGQQEASKSLQDTYDIAAKKSALQSNYSLPVTNNSQQIQLPQNATPTNVTPPKNNKPNIFSNSDAQISIFK